MFYITQSLLHIITSVTRPPLYRDQFPQPPQRALTLSYCMTPHHRTSYLFTHYSSTKNTELHLATYLYHRLGTDVSESSHKLNAIKVDLSEITPLTRCSLHVCNGDNCQRRKTLECHRTRRGLVRQLKAAKEEELTVSECHPRSIP